MTATQAATVRDVVIWLSATPDLSANHHAHHGDAIGADGEFDEIAKDWGFIRHAYPSNLWHQRAFCHTEFKYDPLPPLVRNKKIVLAGQLLLAAPKTPDEQLRSGTWATLRFAVKMGVPILIVQPDGKVRSEI